MLVRIFCMQGTKDVKKCNLRFMYNKKLALKDLRKKWKLAIENLVLQF